MLNVSTIIMEFGTKKLFESEADPLKTVIKCEHRTFVFIITLFNKRQSLQNYTL